MSPPDRPVDALLHDLRERSKELDCLYRVDAILARAEAPLAELFASLLAELPAGWQYPDSCTARLTLGERVWELPGFRPGRAKQAAPILVHGETAGWLEVHYTRRRPPADDGPFLHDERRLLQAIAGRLAATLEARNERQDASPRVAASAVPEWWTVIEFLRQTDRVLLSRLARKMINHLGWKGVAEAGEMLRRNAPRVAAEEEDENPPLPRSPFVVDAATTESAFRLAASHLNEAEILGCLRSWIREEKTAALKHAVERVDTPLAELVDHLERFRQGGVSEHDLTPATQMGLRAALVRRFLTDQLDFVNNAKKYLRVDDFTELGHRLVYPPRSHGRIGGKSSGVFLAAKVIASATEYRDQVGEIRTPKSWYIPSDGMIDFLQHNDLGEVHNRKYDDTDRVRLEYPSLVQLFKSSFFSPEVLRGLGEVLDELEGRPIIVRSSSLLEDRLGSAFSGKYKSLFLANTGTKQERLVALADAVAEVYASVFGPDPIEYRARRGFLDMHEEMGILIQEVVGRRVGPYWLPAFAGVGFSNNEFRWSPRIRREDGLLRLVPGLGTRAVDRLADDYPVLVAPGQPGLRVNQTAKEALRYAPKKMDVINLETGAFEAIDVRAFLAAHGDELPFARQLLSVVDGDRLRRIHGLVDYEHDPLLVTFEGLLAETDFVSRMAALLTLLRERLGTPVDIEFASDGEELYLLQCRPQGSTRGALPAPIPRDVPRDRVLFSANRYVSNGLVEEVTHVVYVDPDGYAHLPLDRLRDVGRAVGRLNRLLPKRRFILVGPGRWGSRGDIRLGVPVTYADISNTSVLVEIARQKGSYVPDLSFGTHFFQDLVESQIRYLPLYPDDPEVIFHGGFFDGAPNALAELLPEFAELAAVVRVIDIPAATGGLVLRVLMNADLDQAVAILAPPAAGAGDASGGDEVAAETRAEDHSRWRLRMAQRLAHRLAPERFGVAALYLFGSTKNATAGPASDIDLLVHLAAGSRPEQQRALAEWLEGWSLCLAEANFLRTGVRRERLLDVQYVTDDQVARGEGYAAKIGAITDPARQLPLGEPGEESR